MSAEDRTKRLYSLAKALNLKFPKYPQRKGFADVGIDDVSSLDKE